MTENSSIDAKNLAWDPFVLVRFLIQTSLPLFIIPIVISIVFIGNGLGMLKMLCDYCHFRE